jgi:acyl transferase domain-containing protein
MNSTGGRDRVAIIGMAGRFPGAASTEELWVLLKEGRDAGQPAADDAEETLVGSSYVKRCMPVAGIENFDANVFGYNAREASDIDPQHRMFLECAWEALENAGYDVGRLEGSVGVFGGAGLSQYLMEHFRRHGMASAAAHVLDAEKDLLCPRVSYKLGLRGPSVSIQTGCSSSLVAVHFAVQSLINRECDMALAGGVSLRIPPTAGYRYVEGGVESPDGLCRAFDAAANGTVPGSGAGIVVLKRYSEAVRSGDYIWCAIRGSAVNNDGAVKVSFAAPSVHAQVEVIASAMRTADVAAGDISYVEAHGTGTVLGDSIELTALSAAMGDAVDHGPPCAVGSIKSNIGHLDTAAGVAGLIKAALCLKHRTIVPSLHVTRPNPALSSSSTRLYINTSLRDWACDGGLRRAGVSSFGMGGTNAHVVLEEVPDYPEERQDVRDELFLFSAATETALDVLLARFAEYFGANLRCNLRRVAFTSQVGRKGLPYRAFVVGSDREKLAAALRGELQQTVRRAFCEITNRKSVFVLPATLDKLPSVGPLFRGERSFSDDVERCATLVSKSYGADLLELMSLGIARGQSQNLTALEQGIVTFAVEWCLARLLLEWGIRPRAYLGEGVGAVTAECLQGKTSLESAVERLVAVAREESRDKTGLIRQTRTPDSVAAEKQDRRNILIEIGAGDLVAAESPLQGSEVLDDIALFKGVGEASAVGRRRVLDMLGTLWLRGGVIEPQVVAGGPQEGRVPLPTYPFERQRYWLMDEGRGELSIATRTSSARIAVQVATDGPRGDLETALSDVWCEVFGLENIGSAKTFFELGGDSLSALRIVSRIEEVTGLKVSLKAFVDSDLTVAKLADVMISQLGS